MIELKNKTLSISLLYGEKIQKKHHPVSAHARYGYTIWKKWWNLEMVEHQIQCQVRNKYL